MSLVERLHVDDDCDPIDVVETLAEYNEWDFDRIADDQIAMVIDGSWRTYSITLSWCANSEMLRFVCSFDIDPPSEKYSDLFDVLNLANSKCWNGSFIYSVEQKMMSFRDGINLNGGATVSVSQLNSIVEEAIIVCERFYPAFQLTCWG